jgi:glycosyltransferase involved in cell wall biosynthesis
MPGRGSAHDKQPTAEQRLTGSVAFILKGYPRLSETFIAQEIRALESRGLDIRIVSLRHPTDRQVHPVNREIGAPVTYLPEYLHQEPLRVLRGWRQARRLAGYRSARRAWLRDLWRDPSPNRIRRFGQALVLAAELPAEIKRLHAHFLHTPASVARYTAMIRAMPWSCSAHAKDIWTTPDWEKREKLADATWLVTCTAAGRDYLAGLAPAAGRVELVYHGLDLKRFPTPPARMSENNGADPKAPLTILSIGRAVEKKGFDDLLAALAALPRTLNWRFLHVGGGPLLPSLKAQAERLGIADWLIWHGAQPQDVVLRHYRAADLFVLASRVARDGDRDGLPNVLMEALSQRVPVIATAVGGVTELITDQRTGLLIAPRDIAGLSRAMESLMRDPRRRAELASAGCERIHRHFDLDSNIGRVAARFGLDQAVMPAEARTCA